MVVKRFHSPIAYMRHKRKQLAGIRFNQRVEFEKIARASLTDGIELTGGHVSSRQLRRMGHPFGRGVSASASTRGGLKRGSRTRIANLPINIQSGQLRRGWHLSNRSVGTTQRYVLGNRARHARYILSPSGTRRMVGRGIWGHSSFTRVEGGPMGVMARRARARLKGLVTALRRRNQRTI